MIRAAGLALLLMMLVGFGLGYCAAHAAPPPGSDPNSDMAKWFESLTNPYGGSCCGREDCHIVGSMRTDKGWQAEYYPGRWIDVPADTVKARAKEPPGGPASAVLCWQWKYDDGAIAPGGTTWIAKIPPEKKNVYIWCFTEGFDG